MTWWNKTPDNYNYSKRIYVFDEPAPPPRQSRLVFVGDRRSGKTTRLIHQAANKNGFIVCCNNHDRVRIAEMARDMGVSINTPITVDDFFNKQPGSMGYAHDKIFYHVDDAERILEYFLHGKIHSISITDETETE